MDLPYGDERNKKFVTNVGLITSRGKSGDNIMACEWTHMVSYSPGLIAVCIRSGKATHENIQSSKEFGVNLCAVDQASMSNIAGGLVGKNFDKIKVLQELGFKFFPAKNINTLMVEGAALNAECKLFKEIQLGSHTMFVGEVVDVSATDKAPLAYHQGKYWLLEKEVSKPAQEELEKINNTVERFAN